jgi:hypothetical protein
VRRERSAAACRSACCWPATVVVSWEEIIAVPLRSVMRPSYE